MVAGEECHRDRPVGFPFGASIDGAQHLAQALTALRCHARVRRRRWCVKPTPVSSEGLKPVRRRFIEQDHRRPRRTEIVQANQTRTDHLIA